MADGRIPLPAGVPERTVRDVLDARASAHPGRIALIAPSLLTGAEVARTYAELRAGAGRLAAALAALGVGKGDRVAIMFDNDGAAEAHLAYHAAHRLGAITVPLNTRYVARELAYVLGVIAPSAIVFAPQFATLLAELDGAYAGAALLEASCTPALGRSLGAALDAAAPDVAPTPLTEHDDADWIFTSGTTGNPKAVALTHGGSVACGIQAMPLWGLDARSVHQSFAPFFTSTGCHTNLLSCLYAGCTLAVEPEFHVLRTIERMQRWRTTSTFLINSVMQLLLDRVGEDALAELELPALRRICHGGQPAGPAYHRRLWVLAQRMGVELTNVYGLTEGGTSGTMLVPGDHQLALERMGPFGLSIGRTTFHPWIEHTVVGRDGLAVEGEQVGELLLRGPSTMSRYVDDPEATAETIDADGWLHTGDLCTVDELGFLAFVDRSKQLIRRGGLNISSAEVEGVLMEHPGVSEVAVVPLPNPVLGEDVRAVVVSAGDPPPDAEELIAFCAVRLADYKVPVRVDLVEALPRNAMGRVLKGALTGQATALVGAARGRRCPG